MNQYRPFRDSAEMTSRIGQRSSPWSSLHFIREVPYTRIFIRRTNERKGCTQSRSQHADDKNVQFVYKTKRQRLDYAYMKCRTLVFIYVEKTKGKVALIVDPSMVTIRMYSLYINQEVQVNILRLHEVPHSSAFILRWTFPCGLTRNITSQYKEFGFS